MFQRCKCCAEQDSIQHRTFGVFKLAETESSTLSRDCALRVAFEHGRLFFCLAVFFCFGLGVLLFC